MPRHALLSASALALIVAGLVSSAPNVRGQTFVATPAPQQFARTGMPSTQNGEWPAYAGDIRERAIRHSRRSMRQISTG